MMKNAEQNQGTNIGVPGGIAGAIIGFLQIHPGLVVTAGYLILTGIGIVYDVLFYRFFGIPIFNFCEPSDFLLAGFRQPLLFVLFVFSFTVLWKLIHKDRIWRHKSPRYRALSEKMESSRWYSNWVIYPLFVVTYFLSTTMIYAKYTANQILHGDGKSIVLELSANSGDPKKNAAEPVYLLLGTNSKYLFLYLPSDRRARVVPVGSISRIILEPAPITYMR